MRVPLNVARLVALLVLLVFCAAPAEAAPTSRLRVAIMELPPWVMRSPSGTYDGFVVRLWQQIAERQGYAYTFVPTTTIQEQLQQVERGSADLALGPMAITAQRARRDLTFSQPYYASHLAILTFGKAPSLWERIQPFLRLAFSVFAGGLLLALFTVGNLVWWFEHDTNPGISRVWSRGVLDGMWLALVTMTTVGYGDRVPITGFGRLTMAFWMLGATLLTSLLTASITTTFTLSNLDKAVISGPEALSGKRVAVVRGTIGAAFVQSYRAVEITAPSFDLALDLLRQHHAEALVYDQPSLEYYLQQHPYDSLTLIPVAWQWETLGFAMPISSPILKPLNISLLELIESGTLHSLHAQWASVFTSASTPSPGSEAAIPAAPAVTPQPLASPASPVPPR